MEIIVLSPHGDMSLLGIMQSGLTHYINRLPSPSAPDIGERLTFPWHLLEEFKVPFFPLYCKEI